VILSNLGDEVRGARIVCVYRRRGREYLVPVAHTRLMRAVIQGSPARAIVEKELVLRA
jgi:hypothetical protein